MTYFLVVEDLARASIGPFESEAAAREHFDWCVNVRGDSASLIAIQRDHDNAADLILTPDEDRSWPNDQP